MNLAQLFEVLIGRWRVIAITVVAMTLLGWAVSSVMPKKYTPSASVLVDARGDDAVKANGGDRSQNGNQAVIATQVDLIASERVARQVVSKLNLDRDPELRSDWQDETDGKGDFTSFLAQKLLKRLDVKAPNRDSNVITISYTGGNAKSATDIVNAFARGGIDANLELKTEPARQYASWFDVRTRALRADLEAAQGRLTAYQRKNGLVSGAGQLDIENAKLAQLAAQLVQVQAARSESNSRQTLARHDARTSPDVLNSPVIAGLRSAITTAEANLKQMGTTLGDRHPQVLSAREQLAGLKAQLESEMQAVARSVTTADTVNAQREGEARAALEAQKARVLALMNGPNDVSVLQRDVDAAQRALDNATTRQSQSALESQVQQTNVYLLAPAAEPGNPSRPKIALYTACAGALGLLLGIGLALWREARTPLVRSAQDLVAVLDLPLLATLPRTVLRIGRPSAGRRVSRIVPT